MRGGGEANTRPVELFACALSSPVLRLRTGVPSGSWQNPYGCAPFVAHALAAGGFVDATPCGGMDEYGAVNYKGTTYNLNVVAKQDPNCGGGLCLADYLLARGWTKTKTVSAGTFCAVVGSDGPYTHTVIGVGDGIVDAHNMAQHHAPISGYTTNLCLNPPSSEVEDAEAVKALRGSS